MSEREQGPERRQQDQPERRAEDVHGALDGPRGAAEARAPDAEHGHSGDGIELDGRTDDLEDARDDRDLHADARWPGSARRASSRSRRSWARRRRGRCRWSRTTAPRSSMDSARRRRERAPQSLSARRSSSSGRKPTTSTRAAGSADSRRASLARPTELPTIRTRSTGAESWPSCRAAARVTISSPAVAAHSTSTSSRTAAQAERQRRERPRERVGAGEREQPGGLVERRFAEHDLVVVVAAGDLGDQDDQRQGGEAGLVEALPGDRREHSEATEPRRPGRRRRAGAGTPRRGRSRCRP